jgi:hypothetical protein
VRRLLVAVSVVLSSPILVTLKEALGYSETSVITSATRRNIPGDTILHTHRVMARVERPEHLLVPMFVHFTCMSTVTKL